MHCDMSFIATFEGETYEDCMQQAKDFAKGVDATNSDVPFSFYPENDYDNHNQRVIYLHPVVVGWGGDKNFPQIAEGDPVYLGE